MHSNTWATMSQSSPRVAAVCQPWQETWGKAPVEVLSASCHIPCLFQPHPILGTSSSPPSTPAASLHTQNPSHPSPPLPTRGRHYLVAGVLQAEPGFLGLLVQKSSSPHPAEAPVWALMQTRTVFLACQVCLCLLSLMLVAPCGAAAVLL